MVLNWQLWFFISDNTKGLLSHAVSPICVKIHFLSEDVLTYTVLEELCLQTQKVTKTPFQGCNSRVCVSRATSKTEWLLMRIKLKEGLRLCGVESESCHFKKNSFSGKFRIGCSSYGNKHTMPIAHLKNASWIINAICSSYKLGLIILNHLWQ